MNLTVKQLIEQNNEKRKLLAPENAIYYEELLIYIRTNPLKDERATEETLLNMLNQLLEAQKEGKKAQEIFGVDPKQFTDQIIQSLPKESTKSVVEFGVEILFTLFGWFLIMWGIWPMINQVDPIIHVGTLIVSTVLLVASLLLLVYLIFKVIRNQVFTNKSKKKTTTLVFSVVIGVLFIVGFFLNFIFEPFGPTMKVSYYTPFGLGCFLLLASYLLKKNRVAL